MSLPHSPAATPLSDRGVKPQATAAGCHFGEILPQGDLDDGALSQLLEELAGEMDRPSDRKKRVSGMVTGPGRERQMNDSRSEGHILFRHDAEFSAERMSDRMTRREFLPLLRWRP